MFNLRILKLSDSLLWITAGALTLIGLLAIFSATYNLQIKIGGDPFLFVKRQFLSLLVALAGLGIFLYPDYRRFRRGAIILYGLALLFLLLVLFTGSSAQGAQRWFQLGIFSFQPSEISKLALIFILAAFLSNYQKLEGLWRNILLLVLVGAPFFLVFKQPDLGTALVFVVILIGMLAASESSPRLLILLVTPFISILLRPLFYLWLVYLVALAVILFLSRAKARDWISILGVNIIAGASFPFLWGMLKSYQRQRIVAFLNPAADPYGAGYHTLQSKIAIGGGGFFGRGLLQGSQTQLQFIPEQHSDFVFSVVGEEFGFIGAAAVLGLFGVMIWRLLFISSRAPDAFGRLLAAGAAVMLLCHVLANVGMALGLLPVVGIPLPFLSFGGTSLLVNLIAVGVAQNVAMRRQKLIF